jgi:DNA-binding transcriptional ArsR family regulator
VSSPSTLGLRADDTTLEPLRAEDFIAQAEDAGDDWLLENIIPSGSITLLVSPPKVGKSRFARQLCSIMEEGGELCGKAIAQGRALYLALVERATDVRKHLRALGAKETLVLARPLRLTPDTLLRLQRWIKEGEIKLLVIDTLNRFWLVESGSDRRQSDMALTPLIDLAHTTGCTILILHHTRKAPGEDGADVAESNDIVAASDQVVYLRRAGKQHPDRRLLQAPGIGRYPPEPDLALEFNEDGIFVGLGDAEQVRGDEERDAVLVHLIDWRTKKELAEDLEMSEPTIRRRLNELLKENLVEKTGRGVTNDPARYKRLLSSPPNPRGESGDTTSGNGNKPTDAPLVRYAVEQLELPIVGRGRWK